jgi:hypothetical protein
MNREKKSAITLINECDSFFLITRSGNRIEMQTSQNVDKRRSVLSGLPQVLYNAPSLIAPFEGATFYARKLLDLAGKEQPLDGFKYMENIVARLKEGDD